MAVPAVWGFLQGFAGQKVKVPPFPRAVGVFTNDWCIRSNEYLILMF